MTAQPAANLHTAAALAAALAARWPLYETTEAALATATTAATTGGTGRGTTIPDPTYTVVISHERYYEVAAEITEALGHLRAVQRRMDAVLAAHHLKIVNQIEAAIRAARCSGEIDPTCTRNAVTRDGLCSACYQRRRRATQASAS